MPQTKNHHFVPQFYFRRFSKDGKSICVLRRDTGLTIERASIKSQASKHLFYGDDEVEQTLAAIEGASSAVLRDIVSLGNPTAIADEQAPVLLTWLMVQRFRTAAARQATKPMADRMAQMEVEIAINTDDALSEERKDELLKSIPFVQANPVTFQRMEMGMAMRECASIADLVPILLSNRTNRPFIFGDAPVVLYNSHYRDVKLRGVLGLTTPGLMLSYPLSPVISLLLLDRDTYRMRGVRNNYFAVRDLHDIRAMNKLQLHASSSCVYFHDFAHKGYVEDLWKQEEGSLADNAGRVVEVPGYAVEDGRALGDIFHAFQPQLPYSFSLSFLDHAVLGDRDFRFGRRANAFVAPDEDF